MKRILCVHHYNDYSGSPRVLSNVIGVLKSEGNEVGLITSSSAGHLSNCNVPTFEVNYTFRASKWHRLLELFWNQWRMFMTIWNLRKKYDIIYVNTLLPFGAAIAGMLTNKQVVYHMHETSIKPLIFKKFLMAIAKHTSSQAIYVSQFLAQQEPLKKVPSTVVYNSLSPEFLAKVLEYQQNGKTLKSHKPTILMLCSLKAYKGVFEFVELARRLPNYNFELINNATIDEIGEYFKNENLPANLAIFPAQNDVHNFYRRAHWVVNLSNVEQWVETFGMTILEAMAYGVPAIAPPVGGPVELIRSGKNGYLIDSRQLDSIQEVLETTEQNQTLYQKLAINAKQSLQLFSEEVFAKEIKAIISMA